MLLYLVAFKQLLFQNLKTKSIKMFVLDEADEMLNRGFKDQIYEIFRNMNSDTQVCQIKNVSVCYNVEVFYLSDSSH